MLRQKGVRVFNMEVYTRAMTYVRWLIDTLDIVSILCVVIIGVIGAFLRKISSSSKHQCTGSTTKSRSNLKTSPQPGKRQGSGSVTFAEGTKFEEFKYQESVSINDLFGNNDTFHTLYGILHHPENRQLHSL